MNRYDFVLLFDAKDANPNGDPDAGNLPRVDPETNQGLVTDVCLKRKVRNYVQTTRGNEPPHEIYFTDGVVLNRQHRRAYDHEGLKPEKKKLPKDVAKARAVTDFMCRTFYDIRTFGAVMSTDINAGQVRGPVQLSFARSIDPVIATEHAITRTSVTNERDTSLGRTMGRKFTVPYGLYRAHGFVNPYLARQTGFGADDLGLLWEAIEHAFQFDQSAARPAGSMATRALLVFEHDNELGRAPSHRLLEAVSVTRKPDAAVPRSFGDYEVHVDETAVPDGVRLLRLV